jgi:hypothetical protein
MEGGCQKIRLDQSHEKKDKKNTRPPATPSAKTAAYVEAGENDNLIVQKLKNPMHWASSVSASWTRTR